MHSIANLLLILLPLFGMTDQMQRQPYVCEVSASQQPATMGADSASVLLQQFPHHSGCKASRQRVTKPKQHDSKQCSHCQTKHQPVHDWCEPGNTQTRNRPRQLSAGAV